MSPSARADLYAALGLAALTVVICGPWVLLHDQTFVGRDSAFTWLAAEHAADAAFRGGYAEGPLGWPLAFPATHADVVLGEGLLALPIRWVDPLVQSDIVGVLGLWATAWAGHRLARALTGPGPHTWVAAMLAGFSPLQLLHLHHVNLVHHEGAVLGGLCAGIALTGGGWGFGLLAGLCVAASWTFGVYLGLQASAVVGAVLLAGAIAVRPPRSAWVALIVGLALSLGTGWIVTAPWRAAADVYDVRIDADELREGSWHLDATLAPQDGVLAHAPLRALWPWRPSPSQRTNPANPGYLAFGLAVAGLVLARKERSIPAVAWWSLGITAAVGAALALGPVVGWLPGPWRLLQILGLDGLRAPARWLWLPFAALGPFAALASRSLADRAGRWSPAVIAAILAGMVIETPSPMVSPFPNAAFEPVYAALDGDGAVYDEALRHDTSCGGNGSQALRAALFHQRPLIGGSYARQFPALEEVNKVAGLWPRPAAIDLFRITGVTTVLEHPPLRAAPNGVACRESDGHRVCDIAPRPQIPARAVPGSGLVVGFRWDQPPETIALRCGDHTETSAAATWTAIAWARTGRSSPVDAFFERPCGDGASAVGGVALVADGTDAWPPPPPRRTRRIADAPEIRDPTLRRALAPPPRRPRGPVPP